MNRGTESLIKKPRVRGVDIGVDSMGGNKERKYMGKTFHCSYEGCKNTYVVDTEVIEEILNHGLPDNRWVSIPIGKNPGWLLCQRHRFYCPEHWGDDDKGWYVLSRHYMSPRINCENQLQ